MPASATLVVTGNAHREAVCRQLPELQDADLVLESEPKDSGGRHRPGRRHPVRARSGHHHGLVRRGPGDQPRGRCSRHAVREAVHTAAAGKIVTIGIKPTHPSTGFGYIRSGGALQVPGAPERARGGRVRGEAQRGSGPAVPATAASMSWNAGMFVAPVSLMLKHLEANQPELFAGLQEIAKAWDTPERGRGDAPGSGPTLPKIAIDYAVAEPAAAAGRRRRRARVPSAGTTSGTSPSVGRLNSAKEVDDVTVLGEGARVFTENASGVVVSDTKRVIALIGIEDVVIVDTPDALLVTTKEHSQRVKQAVDAPQGQRRHRRPVGGRDAGQPVKVTSVTRRCRDAAIMAAAR